MSATIPTAFFNQHVGNCDAGACLEMMGEGLMPLFEFARATYAQTSECAKLIPSETFNGAVNAMQGALRTATAAAKGASMTAAAAAKGASKTAATALQNNPKAAMAVKAGAAMTAAGGVTAGAYKAFRAHQQPPSDAAVDGQDEFTVCEPAKGAATGAVDEETDEGSDEGSSTVEDEPNLTPNLNNAIPKTTQTDRKPVEVPAGNNKCCAWSCCAKAA